MEKSGPGKRKQPAEENTETIWKESDQIRLEELWNNGALSLTDPVAKVKTLDKRFEKLPTRVISHRLALLRKQKSISSSQSSASYTLSQTVSTPPSPDTVHPPKTSDGDECDPFICHNMPFLRFTYIDPITDQQKVVILLDLPGGSRHYEWEFNDSGDGILLRVEWSTAVCVARSTFAGNATVDNPKLRAMQDALLSKGINRKTIPKFCIQVSLGRKVCKDDNAWEAATIQHEGNKILMIEFSEFREKASKKIKIGSFASE